MIKKCIGIPSYLPDDEEVREARKARLTALIKKCNELFKGVEIVIVAQNWHGVNEVEGAKNCTVFEYDKLGITKARQILRKHLLNDTDADYFILLDDDCIIQGDDATEYLKQIDEHPYGFGLFNAMLLKLFAISRFCLEKVDIPNVGVDNNSGFEDAAFIFLLKHKVKGVQFHFGDTGLVELSHLNDADGAKSLWSLEKSEKDIKQIHHNLEKWCEHIVELDSKGEL